MKNKRLKCGCGNAQRGGLILGLGLIGITVLAAAAKEPPKLNVAARPVDRSVRGASYAEVIKRVGPSVVTIESSVNRARSPHPFLNDPRFRQFFGEEEMEQFSRRREEGQGSGVIVTEDGYIITNNHVVSEADEIKIVLSDGKTRLDAKIIGKDPRTDLAVLKVDGRKLPPLTLADSDKLEVGDVVLAVGNPFGVGQSVSMGIVSALGRGELPIGLMAEYEDFIQTDAAINPGNSGGALVDAEGRLIGINQSIVSRSGANAGVGFAIPINLARNVLEKLATDGRIARGFLGVEMQETITPELARELRLPDTSGVLVTDVRPGSPAALAGVQQADVILEFNGKKVADRRNLRLIVSQVSPGTKATMKVFRAGQPQTLPITVGSQPTEMTGEPARPDSSNGAEVVDVLDGVELAELSRNARRQLGVPARVNGVVVARVAPESNAANAELRRGEIIVEVNRQPVASVAEVEQQLESGPGSSVFLRVFTPDGNGSGTYRYVTIAAEKK
jgi:serine protease Do